MHKAAARGNGDGGFVDQVLSGVREQLGLGLDDTRPDPTCVDPAAVRAELHNLLSIARAANGATPWDDRMTSYYKVVFPQMARWLPTEEADQLRRDFTGEMERLAPEARMQPA